MHPPAFVFMWPCDKHLKHCEMQSVSGRDEQQRIEQFGKGMPAFRLLTTFSNSCRSAASLTKK